MAHVVSGQRPDIVVTKDVSGGTAMLFDTNTHERSDFSEDVTAILDVDSTLCRVAVELARADGVHAAADEVELGVRLVLEAGPSERWEAERTVLETLADIAVQDWFDAARGSQ